MMNAPGCHPALPRGHSSFSSSASDSFAASVWSDAASQTSDDSVTSASSSGSGSGSGPGSGSGSDTSVDSYFFTRRFPNDSLTHVWTPAHRAQPLPLQQSQPQPQPQGQQPQGQQQQQHHNAILLPAELRQNPRRTGPGRVASLVRQSDRRVSFVDSLVDSSTQIVETIWPYGSKNGLSLRTFIMETLRRSRTSYSTLQVALYYLILIKPHIPKPGFPSQQPQGQVPQEENPALLDGRRMFLSALILASKYLQDRNYSSRAWSKITGLTTQEINQNEMSFLMSINWKLHITNAVFRRWTEIVLKYTPPPPPPPPPPRGTPLSLTAHETPAWKRIIRELRPDLSNAEALISASASASTFTLVPTRPPSPLSPPRSPSPLTCSAAPSSLSDYNVPSPQSGSILHPAPAPAPQEGVEVPSPTLPSLTPPRASDKASGPFMGVAQPQATMPLEPLNVGRAFSHLSGPRISAMSRSIKFIPTPTPLLSPESTGSNSSRTSRSSSISSASFVSSASSLSSAPLSSDRCGSMVSSDEDSSRGMLPPRCLADRGMTRSPEQYSSKADDDFSVKRPTMTFENMARSSGPDQSRKKWCTTSLENMVRCSESDAAQALQELHDFPRYSGDGAVPVSRRSGLKRERGLSVEPCRDACDRRPLRELPEALLNQRGVRQQTFAPDGVTAYAPGTIHAFLNETGKRVCLA